MGFVGEGRQLHGARFQRRAVHKGPKRSGTNALRHGAAAPVIEQRGGRVTFENRVDDPDAIDVDRLFERFYQGGGARSSAGAGLGLAIVSQLAASMGATAAASLEGDFLRVTVELQ